MRRGFIKRAVLFAMAFLAIPALAGRRSHLNGGETTRIIARWNNLKRALRTILPEAADSLRPGCSHEEIAKFEVEKRIGLPADLRVLYGEFDGEGSKSAGSFGGWKWLPLSELAMWIDELRQIEQDDPSGYPAATAVPFLHYEGEVLYLDSAKRDSALYLRYHEDPKPRIVAGGVSEFLKELTEKLKRGELSSSRFGSYYRVSPTDRELWPYIQEARE